MFFRISSFILGLIIILAYLVYTYLGLPFLDNWLQRLSVLIVSIYFLFYSVTGYGSFVTYFYDRKEKVKED